MTGVRGTRLAAAVVAGLGAAVAVAHPVAAAAPVRCVYTVNVWSGGFMANLSLSDDGPPINGWTVRWTFAEPTSDIRSWSALISQRGDEATATNLPWNGALGPGATVDFGWTAVAAATSVPTDLTLNGVPCS
jgi:cellulase/cellobiase CelA1